MNTVKTLQKLRLLPPPGNDLVPLLLAIVTFSYFRKYLGISEFQSGWNATVKPYPSEHLFVYGSLAIHYTIYLGFSLLVHAAEHVSPLLNKFKIQPTKSTPWSEFAKMAPLVIFNQVFLAPIVLKGIYIIFQLRIKATSKTDQNNQQAMDHLVEELPTIFQFSGTLLIHVLTSEIWFYTIHRFLHENKFLYRHVHSLHHRYTCPSCIESVYVHPLEYVINSFPVLFVGCIVSGAQLFTVWVWVGIVTFLQVNDHSGFWIPFLPRTLMHDYHHQKVKCCFGITGMMDGIFGTGGQFEKFVQEQEKMDSFSFDDC